MLYGDGDGIAGAKTSGGQPKTTEAEKGDGGLVVAIVAGRSSVTTFDLRAVDMVFAFCLSPSAARRALPKASARDLLPEPEPALRRASAGGQRADGHRDDGQPQHAAAGPDETDDCTGARLGE